MSTRVAVLGANGFIGSRIVEMFHLAGLADVRPVTRSVASLARLARFELDCRIADARDQAALSAALAGCEVVVHSIAGDIATIRESVAPVYHAAQQAGARRLVYLSSASVHGQAPPPGTNEESPPPRRQPIAYNSAKAWAERRLLQLRAAGKVELVMLRPGIVTGPRSVWQTRFARELIAGTASWLDDGRGICNSVYVDNLVHAIHLSLGAPAVDGEALLVGDAETVTWADLYRPIASALGIAPLRLPNAPEQPARRDWREAAAEFEASPGGRALASLIPKRVRRGMRAMLMPVGHSGTSPWSMTTHPVVVPAVTPEMRLLYRCQWKLPDTRARRLLGYRPPVSFDEGCRRTVGWMGFAGFPTLQDESPSR